MDLMMANSTALSKVSHWVVNLADLSVAVRVAKKVQESVVPMVDL
jgi:hypothetical protein